MGLSAMRPGREMAEHANHVCVFCLKKMLMCKVMMALILPVLLMMMMMFEFVLLLKLYGRA